MKKSALVRIDGNEPVPQSRRTQASLIALPSLKQASGHDESDAPASIQPNGEGEAELIIECGDLCEPNPGGLGAWALAILCPHRTLIDLYFDDTGISNENTNNVLAYIAVINALIWTAECAADVPVEIRSSSQLVVNQVNGKWQCHSENLESLYETAVELVQQTRVVLRWIPFRENQTANLLAQVAYIQARREKEGEDD